MSERFASYIWGKEWAEAGQCPACRDDASLKQNGPSDLSASTALKQKVGRGLYTPGAVGRVMAEADRRGKAFCI
jgi:hypothetical protein